MCGGMCMRSRADACGGVFPVCRAACVAAAAPTCPSMTPTACHPPHRRARWPSARARRSSPRNSPSSVSSPTPPPARSDQLSQLSLPPPPPPTTTHFIPSVLSSCRLVLCHPVSCRQMLCHPVSCRLVLCHPVPCSVALCHPMSCRLVRCCDIRFCLCSYFFGSMYWLCLKQNGAKAPVRNQRTNELTSARKTSHEPLVKFMYLVFTRMPGESYRRRLWSLFRSCDGFRALLLYEHLLTPFFVSWPWSVSDCLVSLVT